MHPEWPPEKDTLWDVFFFGTAKGRSIDISKLVNVFIHATKHASFIRPSERERIPFTYMEAFVLFATPPGLSCEKQIVHWLQERPPQREATTERSQARLVRSWWTISWSRKE